MNITKQFVMTFFGAVMALSATSYDVGPNQPFAKLGAVPWNLLTAGDVVNIHYQPGCYAEKFLISTQGTSWSSPITVQGVNDPATGKQACVTGLNAVQAPMARDRWSGAVASQYSESLYVVGVALQSGASTGAAYVVINNLDISGAAQGASYTSGDGTTQTYQEGVAGVRILNGNHIRVQNCYIHNIGGNGVFGKPNQYYPGTMADIQLLNNHFGQNGKVGSYLYHNTYVEADQSLYSGNLYEPLVAGSQGIDLKDRSAGTTIKYNSFRGSAARIIDLVEPQDGWALFGSRPYYGEDFVYGNLFYLNAKDANFAYLGTPIHYGGDQDGLSGFRNRTLSFYNNTFAFVATLGEQWKQGIFQPELPTATVDVRNNIFMFSPSTLGAEIPEIDWSFNNNRQPTGNFQFGVNWISPGARISYSQSGVFNGTSSGLSNLITFDDNRSPLTNVLTGDLSLAAQSGAAGVAGVLTAATKASSLGVDNTTIAQYQADMQTVTRVSLADLGALASTSTQTLSPAPTPTPIATSTPTLTPAPAPTPTKTIVIQNGLSTYTGGASTAISDLYTEFAWNNGAGFVFPDAGYLLLTNQKSGGGQDIRTLLSFPGLSVTGLKSVVSAELTLTMSSWIYQGPFTGYYLRQKWDNTLNWSMSTNPPLG